MLILSRRPDESIILGDQITVTIIEVKGQSVRIGINAPPEVSIHREEVYHRIVNAQQESTEPVNH